MSKPSWAECRAANMSAKEAAEAMGVTRFAAYRSARSGGWKWRGTRSEVLSARMKARHQDPAFNSLVLLSPAERAEYDRMIAHPRDAVLAAIGRADLIKGAKE